jgi:hypothetical protein
MSPKEIARLDSEMEPLEILLEPAASWTCNSLLHLQLEWSQWPGLNRRPTVYETVALPLSYIGFHTRFAHDDNFFSSKINPVSAPPFL